VRSFAWILSLGVGFLSLSQEIVWIRIVGFAYAGAPFAFSFTLAHFLIGIACGAVIGRRVCARARDLPAAAGWSLLAAAALDLFLPAAAPVYLLPFEHTYPASIGIVIAVTAAAKSVLFPIAHQLGSQASGPAMGRSISRVYFANIIGSTLGPLVTGYILLDHFSVDQLFMFSGIAMVLLAALGSFVRGAGYLRTTATLLAALALGGLVSMQGDAMLQRLATVDRGESLQYLLSSRAGVVHAHTAPHGGDVVYGGNVYDGRASINVEANENRLDRLYLMGLMQNQPRTALVIGLSTGAWTRALQGFPTLQSIDVVEINAAYLAAVRRYPDIAPILADPRIHIHIDDGRRWLRRNPARRFDLIVQNTTFHWRANSSSLLSAQYMGEVLTHLTENGITTINTTGSYDVIKTAAAVFPHAYRYANFVYGSRQPLSLDTPSLGALLQPDNTPFPTQSGIAGSVQQRLHDAHLQPAAAALSQAGPDVQVITDDNLLVEYRHGRRIGPEWLERMLPPLPRKFTINSP
jgi:spermidine synthase